MHLSPIELRIILCALFSGGITFFLIPSIVQMANVKSLVAVPGRRTSHDAAIPNLGGIPIYIGMIIAYLLFLKTLSFAKFQFLIASSMIIFFVGFKDDITGLIPFKKFFGQIVAAWIIISFGGIRLTSLYGFFGIYEIESSLSYLITIIAIVGITNCFNLMDGIDGLAASLAIVASVFFGAWFYYNGDYDWVILTAALGGSLVAFFIFNVFGQRNKIFMGDTGSLTLGYLIAVIAIYFNQKNLETGLVLQIHAAPAVSIGFILLPIFDTLRVMLTRILNHSSPFAADRTHLHHYLLKTGMNHKQATFTLLTAAVFLASLGFVLRFLEVLPLLVILFLIAGIISWFIIRKANIKQVSGTVSDV